MRIFLVVVLALVAIGAGGVWALGQFGDQLSPGVEIVAREPIVREPELVAAPAAPPPAEAKPNTKPSLSSKPAEPKKPAAAPTAAPETPAVTPAPADAPAAAAPAAPAKPNPFDTRSSLNSDKPAIKLPNLKPAPAPAPAAAPPAQTAAPSIQSREAPEEPVLKPQQVEPAARSVAKPAATPTQAAAAAAGVSAPLAAQFKSRKVTYNRPPAKLQLSKAVDVSLVINATDDADAGQKALQGFPGTVVERDVDLSDIVRAQLTGVGFDIASQTVERQKLSGKTLNRWQWRVTPTETGTRTLMLEIFGYESGSDDAEPLDAYRDEITVEVQQLDQVITWAKMVQPVFAVVAALAGAVSAFLAFMRFRSERKGKKGAKA